MFVTLTLLTILADCLWTALLAGSIDFRNIMAIDIKTVSTMVADTMVNFMGALRSILAYLIGAIPSIAIHAYRKLFERCATSAGVVFASPDHWSATTSSHTPNITTAQSGPVTVANNKQIRPRHVSHQHIVSGPPLIMVPTGGYECNVM
jgi:hypothetical protein